MILAESRPVPVSFLHAEVAVVLRGDAIFTLVDALDAVMAPAALGADRLVGVAGVLGPPTPLAAPRHLPAVFP